MLKGAITAITRINTAVIFAVVWIEFMFSLVVIVFSPY
jgi:hypothetical protein